MQHHDGTADVGTALSRPSPALSRPPLPSYSTSPVGTALSRPPLPSYSTCISQSVAGPPQRGLVHSVFTSAANILFPNNFVLSLNIATSPRMPNGIHLPAFPHHTCHSERSEESPPRQAKHPATSLLSHLRPNMPVLLGANRLYIQPLDYILDLSHASQWNPHIEHPPEMNMDVLHNNIIWLKQYLPTIYNLAAAPYIVGTGDEGLCGEAPCGRPSSFSAALCGEAPCGRPSSFSAALCGEALCGRPSLSPMRMDDVAPCGRPSLSPMRMDGVAPCERPPSSIIEMARIICGRGQGLTPDGDDILAGWMAMGWLLHGPQPDFLATCQQIVAIARQQTHLLSQCWLEYAANGYVAEPILAFLYSLTQDNRQILTHALNAVLAMGATSGYNVIQGILLEQALYSSHST